MSVTKICLIVLFFIACLFFIGWLIGYPIYRKVIKEPVWVGSNYAIGTCVIALVINIINLFVQIMK